MKRKEKKNKKENEVLLDAEDLLDYFEIGTKIIDGLYLGSTDDAMRIYKHGIDCVVICVHEWSWPLKEFYNLHGPPVATTIVIPYIDYDTFRIDMDALDFIVESIDYAMKQEKTVFVHCGAGIERSPLAVAYYLLRKKGMCLDEAYDFIKAKRPIVEKRDDWLFFMEREKKPSQIS